MTKTAPARGSPMIRRGPPEISIEWMDVTIDIRVCGIDLPPEDQGYKSLFPRLDEKLISSDIIDMRRAQQKEKRKIPGYKYETIPVSEEDEEIAPKAANYKVLPKLTCRHCNKTFSRKSTLDQHLVSHSSERWADVQDAAIKDLEQAIAFSGEPTFLDGRKNIGVNQQQTQGGEEEEEISPPPDVKEESKEKQKEKDDDGHRCTKCGKSFGRLSLLNRHMKLHSGIKPWACTVCGWRFLQRYNLKKHMMTHSQNKPHKCGECDASFSEGSQLRNHLVKQHNQGTSNTSGGSTTAVKKTSDEENTNSGQNGSSNVVGEGMVPCPKCDRTFAAKSHLERHMPVHTTMVKPYSCVVCGWRFHLLHNMQRHLATHKTQDKAKTKGGEEEKASKKEKPEEAKE